MDYTGEYGEGFRRPRRSKLFDFDNGFGVDGTLNAQSERQSREGEGE